jgi:hypothetical protein
MKVKHRDPGQMDRKDVTVSPGLMDEQLMGKHWRKNTRAGIFK